MAPFITRHSIKITLDDIMCLLREPNPLTSTLSQEVQAAISTMGTVAHPSAVPL